MHPARARSVARWRSYSYRHRFCTLRGKMAATTSFCWHRSRTSLGACSPCKVDGTRAKDLWCVPAGSPQGPVCESRPGLYTRPGQIWVLGSAGRSTGSKASCPVSKDSQRLRGWTQDEPVDHLQAGSKAEEEQLVESLLITQIPDRQKQFLPCLSGRASRTASGDP